MVADAIHLRYHYHESCLIYVNLQLNGADTLMDDWAVYRLDFNSNEFVVEKGLSQEGASRLAEEYIAKGHHQHYWVDKQPADDPDFLKLVRDMIGAGSSHDLAIRVLLSQGATITECVSALTAATDLSAEESSAKVSGVVEAFGQSVE